ncbi:TAXI family TRAP transporter solute-binding subunit [Micromonospora zingiberis]|uniref:TAXI family TRAP transporter solute-binding subunit n=1 Tax=Micromonospora zingiberis TaxID=2053011 RepID=A0A4R0GM42_9ACTN|nr:TAXI family TRAP transporter solute-binding subunit [Micromonospora zingiberis]TCB98446.1 TAXI family TRAP transporter solute-binding subunit [Micromonospora zingiberis]
MAAPASLPTSAFALPAPTRRAVLGAGLGALVALTGCTGRVPRAPEPLRLATGPPGAVYREIGQAYADILRRAWPARTVEVLHTAAAVENARLIDGRDAELAFVNCDVAVEHPEIRALSRVFDSVVHVVVPADSSIHSATDLHGRAVAGGLAESGTRFVVTRLAELLGLRLDFHALSQADSVAALRAGRVDAVVSLTGMPTPAVSQLAAGGDVRLLDLTDEVATMAAEHPLDYFPVTIPATMYPPMASVVTLAVPTLLVAHASMAADLARYLTGLLFDHAEELSGVRPEASQINPRTGAATAPVALHPGARDWFRAAKP